MGPENGVAKGIVLLILEKQKQVESKSNNLAKKNLKLADTLYSYLQYCS